MPWNAYIGTVLARVGWVPLNNSIVLAPTNRVTQILVPTDELFIKRLRKMLVLVVLGRKVEDDDAMSGLWEKECGGYLSNHLEREEDKGTESGISK